MSEEQHVSHISGAHTCRPSLDPRKQGLRCACGLALPQRDREWETTITRELTAMVGTDAEHLIRLAGDRADAGEHEYGHAFPPLSKNLEREAMEELADCRNYVVWRLDQIRRGLVPDLGRTERLQRAIRHIALAYDDIRASEREQ